MSPISPKPAISRPESTVGRTDARVTRGEKTRQALIDAAFAEIHRHGYRAASLNDILGAANCTKGSLYHHFPDKHALGLAAASENIEAFIAENWLTPLAETTDPLTTIRGIIQRHVAGETMKDIRLGCPMQNLSQEMAPLDEDFRHYLNGVFNRWTDAIADALRRGMAAGTVRQSIDPHGLATIIVATHQGMISLIKTAQDPMVGANSAPTFFNLLETMRPTPESDAH